MQAFVPVYAIEEDSNEEAEKTAESFVTEDELENTDHELIMVEAIGGEDVKSVEVHIAIEDGTEPEEAFPHAESVREAPYEF